jgi:hypothetical protein
LVGGGIHASDEGNEGDGAEDVLHHYFILIVVVALVKPHPWMKREGNGICDFLTDSGFGEFEDYLFGISALVHQP